MNPSPPPPSYTHLDEGDTTPMTAPSSASNTFQATPQGESPLHEKNSELEARFARLEEMIGKQRLNDTTADGEIPTQHDEKIPMAESQIDNVISTPSQEPEPPSDTTQKLDVGLFTRFDLFLKAQRRMEVHDASLVADLESVLEKHASRSRGSYSIKFKDAVGRKFTFPFHLASKWAVSILGSVSRDSILIAINTKNEYNVF
jgi:uncharacterized protein YceH (UPF0502 family)